MTGSPAAWQPMEDWFAARDWQPFPFQRETWQAMLAGESGLVHAPTGTGKTYAVWFGALLRSLDAIARLKSKRALPLRVLWITPLRALAADIAGALQTPLDELGLPWTLETRTGDTSTSARSRQKKQLPTALVTTPESLSLLLTWHDAEDRFADLDLVIVDEWHELVGSKRGVQTELALARIRRWRPNLATWALSATIGNLSEALQVLLGPKAPAGRIVQGFVPKDLVIDSVLPTTIERFPWAGHLGIRQLDRVLETVDSAESALVFTNTRSQTEIWYQAILAARKDWAGRIALHHGSLDRSVREYVEAGLRDRSLRCVVCTSTLDLGVDFAPVDRVLQVGSPKGVARLLQRAGRSGHSPGRPSRVTCVPTHALELIEVAAARRSIEQGRVEPRAPHVAPMDVLVQHVVTIALGSGFLADELYDEVRTTHAYQSLTEHDWQWVLQFVTQGGTALHAYPEFHRVERDPLSGYYVVTSQRVARNHRMAIGTIASDASLEVKYLRGGRLGTIEETFISRLKPGESFIFAGKTLVLVRVRDMTAYVRRGQGRQPAVPRWLGGRLPLSNELATAVRETLDEAHRGVFASPELKSVQPILELQARWSHVPAADELLIERVKSREGYHTYIYPLAGRLVHEGVAALVAYRISRLRPISFTWSVNDWGLELLSHDPPPLDEALDRGLFTTDDLEADILASLNAAEMAKRQFREIARIAGLIFSGHPGARKSMRQVQASAGLFYDVFTNYDPDNLLLRQALDEVLSQQLEATRLRATLERISGSRLIVTHPPKPTPLAFPLLVDRLREKISSEKLADRIARMTLQLEREAERG